MKYKLIASDIDDTLFRNDHTVSGHTREVIAEYIRRGGVFTLSTGRSHDSLIKALKEIALSDSIPVISCQGAIIRDSVTGITYLDNSLPYVIAKSFIEEMESNSMYLQLYHGARCLSNAQTEFTEVYTKATGIRPEFIGPFSEYVRGNITDYQKIMVVSKPEIIAEIISKYRARYPELTMEITSPYMLEVYSAKAGKGGAVKYIAEEIMKIDRSEVVAFGDSRNDISMLKYAGMGIAVQNAHPDVLACADYITLSNNEDGVAAAIEKLIL